MKRFHFPLERLLKVKKHLERLAEQRQLQARAVFESARAEVVRAEARTAEAAAGGLDALRRSATLGMWEVRYSQVAALERAVVAAQAQAKNAEQRLEAASLARVRIAIEVEALAQLRLKQWQSHMEETARRVQEQLDEVGMRRWHAARSGVSGDISSRGEDR